jgi:hypothetical protein
MNQTWIFEDPLSYADHSLDKYGMEGMSPLHIHDSSGVIHVESNMDRYFTLGDILDIWNGLNTEGKNVASTVDGIPVSDFRSIVLNNGSKIVLDIPSKVS